MAGPNSELLYTLATMPNESVPSDSIRWNRFPILAACDVARKQLAIESALGLAQNTLEAYGRAREDFFRFCMTRETLPELANREEIALWVRDMLSRSHVLGARREGIEIRPGLANATVHQKLTAVRLYFDFLVDQGQRADNPVGHGRYSPGRASIRSRGLLPRHQRLPWIPGNEEWEAMTQVVASESVRNRVMFCLAYDAALRREELCRLAISDVDFANRFVTIRAEIAKGRRQRIVPYSTTSALLLAAYLKRRRLLSLVSGPAFLSESRRNLGKPLTIWTWSKAIERISAAAEVPKFTTHTFRHLCLTDLARSGWDIHEIATFAGHRSIETTKNYIHLSSRDLAVKISRGVDQIHQWRLRMMEGAGQ